MSSGTSAMWGKSGRGDLAIIRALGANAVRLYGNNPALEHGAFLDEAAEQGLDAIVGISDYPYIQMQGSCKTTGFNCYEQIKEQYSMNLKRGFLKGGKAYHPALRTLIVMNEPDLKLQPIAEPRHFCRALVSAFDAVLDAEKEAGVEGPRPNFTATFSFGVCPGCSRYGYKPAIGQMLELRHAMEHPESVGYTPRNDLGEAYRTRFVNSFNTANPAADIMPLFLDTYDATFLGTPVFIGEYHSPSLANQQEDLEMILGMAASGTTMLMGLSFFEFQVRYDKGGQELMFGIFGLGDVGVGSVNIQDRKLTARCLSPMEPPMRSKVASGHCGWMEQDVEYVVDTWWTIGLDNVSTPELCCGRCGQEPKCRAWTWVEKAELDGNPSQCWLKDGKPTSRGRKAQPGFVSGLPPPRSTTGQWKEVPLSKAAQGGSTLVSTAIAKAFGGSGVNHELLCPATAIVA